MVVGGAWGALVVGGASGTESTFSRAESLGEPFWAYDALTGGKGAGFVAWGTFLDSTARGLNDDDEDEDGV